MEQPVRKRISENHEVNKDKDIYTLLVDGNSLFKRSISIDKRVGDNGLEYGGIYQFLLQLKMMLNKKSFDYVYVFWDGEASGILRYHYYSDYKKNRDKKYELYGESDYAKQLREYERKVLRYAKSKKSKNEVDTEEENFERQRNILFSILEELFIRQCISDKVEGDDLIAYYVNNKKSNEKIVIMSGDLDITQLISDTVCVYALNLKPKQFITKDNSIELLGYTHENVALIKTICGDVSDNISSILGFGASDHKTLFKYFPELITKKCTIEEIKEKAKKINEERVENKQKPFKNIENLLNEETKGNYDGKILEINDILVNLSKPLLTKESIEEMDEIRYNPLDPEDRNFSNIRKIIRENKMIDLLSDNVFDSFFSSFSNVINNEKKRYKK